MNPVYVTGNMINPGGFCGVNLAIPNGSGVGSASSIVTAGPANCSGIFDAFAAVGGTTTNNAIKIVIPPQILLQAMWERLMVKPPRMATATPQNKRLVLHSETGLETRPS